MLKRTCGAFVAAALVQGSSTARASIVYSHYVTSTNVIALCNDYQTSPRETSSDMEVPGGNENFSQVAQRLTLAGTDRFVTRLEIGLIAFLAPCTTDVTAYLYANQGGLPGALLWSGSATGIALVLAAGNLVAPVSFAPNVTVPDSVFFAFSHANIVNQTGPMGTAALNHIIGLGDAGNWANKDSTTGLWSSQAVPDDLSVRITAVPGPGAPLWMLAGLIGLRTRRR